jgi:FMN phosphatase YigB (HAD superfamily)
VIRAVVFDAGETIVNESRQWRMWADWLGVEHHAFFALLGSVIERGEHHHRVFELLRPGFDLNAARRERFKRGEPDMFDSRDLYPDAAPCLLALAARGLRIGVAANQPDGFEQAMRELALPLDFVASSTRWGVEKPSPEFFARVIEAAGFAPDEIAYVGDRIDNDVVPSRAAGLLSVFLRRGPWGIIQARRADAAQAHLRIENLDELIAAL